MLFPLFALFGDFTNTWGFAYFFFFLPVSCAFVAWPVFTCMWSACNTRCASKKNLNAMWWSCGGHNILVAISHTHMLAHNYVLRTHQ
jgi:hypothetical protein